jgi:putative nucleotidyltransferase with HDIG domain
MLGDRSIWLRLVIAGVALVALIFAVEAWQAPFRFHLHDVAPQGVTARIDFGRVDALNTERQRTEREEEVPFVFNHDPKPLENLPAKLRSSLGEVAMASRLSMLPSSTKEAFGLTDRKKTGAKPADGNAQTRFNALKQAVSAEQGTTGNRIDEILAEFVEFTAPLKRGLLDSKALERANIHADDTIGVFSQAAPQAREVVAPTDVQLTQLVQDTGRLGKSWESYERLDGIRPQLTSWLLVEAPVTLHYDPAATRAERQRVRASVDLVTEAIFKGDILVRPGEQINEQSMPILKAEYDALQDNIGWGQRIFRVGTVFTLLIVLASLNGYYLLRNHPHLVRSLGQLSVYLATIVLAVLLARLASLDPWRAEVVPIVTATMIFAIAYNQVLATITAFTLSLIATLSTGAQLGEFVVLMSVATTAVIPLHRVASRSTLIKVGFLLGTVFSLVTLGTAILGQQVPLAVWSSAALFDYSELLTRSLAGAGWCVFTGFLVAGGLPFIERTFGVVTDISLLELSDVSHPLLKEFVSRAPGTYNHSISVATIGEAAADRIGANGLLVRVGAYFHDIGKMLKPNYFIENMSSESDSRHEHLAPAMSTLIIIGHVKDGSDLARRHHLPQPIIDFIEQHHGTTLVEYFFHEATKQADQQPDHKTNAEESSFRYPGPKPMSREAGVMMLADAVESASRTLVDPTPKRIESLVHEITLKRLMDGQFDDSSLTLSEIHVIEESLVKSLTGIYHGRIKYPEQRTA